MKQLLFVCFLLCSATVYAQDVIVKKDGSTILCRVVSLTSSEIVYKKWTDLNGPNCLLDRSIASSINYQDGKKIDLSEVTNLYEPGNQNDGTLKLNDNALLKMDYVSRNANASKKAKTLRIVGIAGGITLVGAGIILFCATKNLDRYGNDKSKTTRAIGIGCCVTGVAFTTGFLISAAHYQKLARKIESTQIFKQELPFNNGTSLVSSLDLLNDSYLNTHAIGLGLRYHF